MQRVVVVTGASAGVGRAAARAFGREGAAVALLARGRDGLEGARREVERAGGRALVAPVDVADPEQVEEAARAAEEALGPLDVWVNDAIVTVLSPVASMRPQEYRRVIEVNYLGTVHGTLAALRRMLPRDRGAIVQVGSALSYRGIPLQSAYCASKFAVRGFTESLRTELLHEGSRVRLSMVQLPALNTPQFTWCKSRLPRRAQPVPPIFEPEVAARAITWASHHDRRELFVGGSAVKTIWGNKLAPWAADRLLARSGYEAQQRDGPEDPGRPHNLWEPAPGDRGVRGPFGRRARSWSYQLATTTHRVALGALAAAAAGLLVAWYTRRAT